MPVPPFDEVDQDGHIKFDPSKYKTAKHSGRELMGWDAAIARADADPDPIRWCLLTEGPLDGARVGPGGLIIIGKSLSQDNAAKVAQNFHMVMTAFDNDRYGREATEKISAQLFGSKCRDSKGVNFRPRESLGTGRFLPHLSPCRIRIYVLRGCSKFDYYIYTPIGSRNSPSSLGEVRAVYVHFSHPGSCITSGISLVVWGFH